MNKFYSYGLSAALLLGGLSATAQNRPASPAFSLGSSQGFVRELETQVAAGTARRQAPTLALRVSATQAFSGKVNHREDLTATGEYVVGEIQGVAGSSFMVRIEGPKVEGHILLPATKQAFRYSSDAQGNTSVQEVDINQVICIDYDKPTGYVEPRPAGGTANRAAALSLQSLPGARGCVMLDVDGYALPAGTGWNRGNAYNAPSANMTDADVQAMWELVSEDFRFLSLNVTTDENVYNSYPNNLRMRCVISPGSASTIAPGAGGVAFLTSFRGNDETPCWVFMSAPKAGGEAASHEVGHTLGLSHDGRTSPAESYYDGKVHKNWSPIMGVGYYKPVTQWSKGEYNQANQTQDDLAIMSGPTYNVGYRPDDHANGTSGATALARSGNSVSGNGIIERTADQDYFSFTTSGGAVSVNVNTVGRYGNLDIVARLFDGNGALLGTYDTPAGTNAPNLNATVSANLGAGTYYLQVDGTSSDDPATNGYSDYSSLGTFTISGTIPAGGTQPQPTGVATLFRDCPFAGASVSLPVGDYTLSQLQARGILNNDISSLRVSSGFEVALFDSDNFTGESITVVGDADCLVGRSFNDRTTSVRVRTVGTARLYQDCDFGGYTVVLPAIGTYSTNQLLALGFRDNDISALRVNSGFEVVLYENDNLGGASLTVGANTNCLVAASWNDRVSSVQVRNVGSAPASALLQAENANVNNGMQVEATTDAGGGQNMGYVDSGDYLVFNSITFPTAGTYTIEYRVASLNGSTLSSDLDGGGMLLGNVSIPATGGWQNWTTVSQTITAPAGTYNFGVFAQSGGWNINWVSISGGASAPASAPAAAAAEPAATTAARLSFSVYPNPVSSRLSLTAATSLEGEQVGIFDQSGRQVWRGTYDGQAVDVSGLRPGMYTLVVLGSGRRKLSTRFSKQ